MGAGCGRIDICACLLYTSEVSGAADQVASSSNDLADGATNQAAVVEELTATVAGVSEQVGKNSDRNQGEGHQLLHQAQECRWYVLTRYFLPDCR